jgi:transglutaminase-like putative cysteine protease
MRDWVAEELSYVSGSSRFTDGAVDTLLARRGVCRDYAHLLIALLRARDIPARLASVYAPGLSPMDFHAVVEAWVDGTWHLLDATGLAPRASMLRIATGRDATDTAFVSTVGGSLQLTRLTVTATVDALPVERAADRASLR